MIFVECDADKTLIKTLGITRKEMIHAGDKGGVCNRLKKVSNSKGLVDEDPESPQPKYINTLKCIHSEDDIKLLADEKAQNYLVILCPKLEDWILKSAMEARIDVSSYGLPNNPTDFHKIINIHLEEFDKLVKDMWSKSKRLKSLKGFIRGEG